MPNEFTDECFILRNNEGQFCYGECSGNGYDFDSAEKWNDEEDAIKYIWHHKEYDSIEWKIFRVKINYKIVEEL